MEGQQNDQQGGRREGTRVVERPNGRHPIRAISHAWGEAGTGTVQLGVECEVTEGPFKGYRATWYGSLTENATEMTIRGMRALGFKGIDIQDMSSMFQGEVAIGVFETDTDNEGNERTRIAFVNAAGVAMKKVYEGAELAHLAQRMRGLLAHDDGGGRSAPKLGQGQQGNGGGQQQQQSRGFGGGSQQSFGRGGGGQPPPQRDAPPPQDNDAPPWGNGRGGGSSSRW
jgi:hypothetical protein